MGFPIGFIWVEWPFILCLLEVLLFLVTSLYVLARFESFGGPNLSPHDKASPGHLRSNQLWECCFGRFHPAWLFALRAVAVAYMLAALIYDLIDRGPAAAYIFYTRWSFTLLIVYFLIATCISLKKLLDSNPEARSDQRQRLLEEGDNVAAGGHVDEPAGLLGHVLLVIFQVASPAVLLTDGIYWIILVPFVYGSSYYETYTSFSMHFVNAVFLFGELLLNSLPFPWHRFAYFILLSVVFVVLQWILHLTKLVRVWPYSFLNVSSHWAPLWYLGLGLYHLLVYYVCIVLVKAKARCLRRQ